MTLKYGFFDSAFSAADAVASSVEQTQLVVDETGLFWVEPRPEESGRSILRWRNWDGEIKDLTPKPFSVRSGVYEYGGKSWCLLEVAPKTELQVKEKQSTSQLAFVNGDDQQIWLQPIVDSKSPPKQLTQEDDCRYGDLVHDPSRQRIIAIQEKLSVDPTQPEHSLVAVCISTGAITTLSFGQDFYASPTLDQSANKLAWITWNHPDMPWVKTQLHVAEFRPDGLLSRACHLSELANGVDSPPESVQQPRFYRDGSVIAVSDSSGWWNLHKHKIESNTTVDRQNSSLQQKAPLWPALAEFGIAQWQFGVSTWDWITKLTPTGEEENFLVASYLENGRGFLALRQISAASNKHHQVMLLATEFSNFRHISCFDGKIYCVASSDSRTAAILEITPDYHASATVRVLGGDKANAKLSKISRPQSFTYPVENNEVAYGFLYMPATIANSDKKPPLLVFTHGGPTATTYAVYNPKIQFWTERGFAVVDLNYRGSAGFGRDYRLRLAGQWGVTDVQDVVAAADYLADQGLTDSRDVFIRGGSAGGYTTLCALAFSDRFRGGASYYGVSDPITLTRDTHKFESHYLDWLIGDPVLDLKTYQTRSPLNAAKEISCPMIFFQGGKDKVVVEDQTERMVEALRSNGIVVDYHCYPEEQHGFRSSENQIHSLEAELAFYQSLLLL